MRGARRRRGGGHQGRIARARSSSSHPPFLTRPLPPLHLLGEEGLALIEANADVILKDVGMDFRGDAEVLEILKAVGADVRGERVRFEKGLCRSIIQKSAPGQFIQHARNPARSVVIGGPHTVLAPSGGSPFVHDLDRGRRYATSEDFRDLIKLAQTEPDLHHAGGKLATLTDKPVAERHLHMVEAQFTLSDKPIIGSASGGAAAARDTVKMAELVFGERFVAENCVIYCGINTNSPLVLDATMMDAMKVYARANQAVTISAYILAGATGPVGLAGVLAQQLAESMGGLTLYQLLHPGAPCTMGTFVGAASMQTGAPAYGTPESLVGGIAAAELARRLGVPVNSAAGAVTSSPLPDAQAAYESALTLQSTFLSGANIIWHCAGWLEGGLTVGYEKLMLDADLCSVLTGLARGLDLSPAGQSMEALREIEPDGHFFGASHTQEHFETALWRPGLWSAKTFEQWQEEGSLDAAWRANRLWKERLRTYEAPPIDPAIAEALADYCTRRITEIGQSLQGPPGGQPQGARASGIR